jgi:DNA-binding SARP family transcriptional activator
VEVNVPHSDSADTQAKVRVDVLGPLRLVVDGSPVEMPGPKRRAVLALLAIAEGRVVAVDHLLDAVWPADPPESARAALHSHVSRLRGHLGRAAPRLQALSGGYRLVLEDDELDVARARSLLARARGRAGRRPAEAAALVRQARALWRGPVLPDLTNVAPIAAWSVTLDELRRDVSDLLVACALEAGEIEGVVSVATEAVAADPLREPAVLLLMRVLAATGRAPEALRAGYEHRRRLAEETGLDPSPALGELEHRIAIGAAGATSPRTGTIPRPATRLAGRDSEVAALQRLVAHERLVTVVGPGGVGKTRVALEVARRADTATVLLLAPVTDPAAIAYALAATLDLRVVQGDVLSACAALLAAGPRLLMVDNCEHLLGAVADAVSRLIDACPELTVLATSREPLGLAAERRFRVAPLPLPDPEESGDLGRIPSVAVFVDRARRVRPGFRAAPEELRLVGDIVRRLDGMPLAIELAAGRLSSFGLADLHARLDRSLDLLGDGRATTDARHRTLRATIECPTTFSLTTSGASSGTYPCSLTGLTSRWRRESRQMWASRVIRRARWPTSSTPR